MPSILHDFLVASAPEQVFEAVSDPAGLGACLTLGSAGGPIVDSEYTLNFGPRCVWRARGTSAPPGERFELELTDADADWTGTRVGFRLGGEGRGRR